MDGIKNFLMFVYSNWTTILVCAGLIVGIVKKSKDYFSKSTDEKVEIAKAQISETMLDFISIAELDWEDWKKAGSIKRSQVISDIYKEYPILSKVVNQKELIKWIDDEIDNSLDTLREVIKNNKDSE